MAAGARRRGARPIGDQFSSQNPYFARYNCKLAWDNPRRPGLKPPVEQPKWAKERYKTNWTHEGGRCATRGLADGRPAAYLFWSHGLPPAAPRTDPDNMPLPNRRPLAAEVSGHHGRPSSSAQERREATELGLVGAGVPSHGSIALETCRQKKAIHQQRKEGERR